MNGTMPPQTIFRLEICPSEFVQQVRVGIMGSSVKMGDSLLCGIEDKNNDDEDGREDGKSPKKGKGNKLHPDAESVLCVWMPAVIAEYAYPGLVAEWEEKKGGKEARKCYVP